MVECAAAWRWIPQVAEPLAGSASLLLSTDHEWEHVPVQGFVKGKEGGRISMLSRQAVLL